MRRRKFLLSTAALASLSGCSEEADTTDPTTKTTGQSDIEEPELPAGLHEDGIQLEQLRSAVDELVTTGAFRIIAGIDRSDQDEVMSSTSRSVSGIKESERGRELEGALKSSDGGSIVEQGAFESVRAGTPQMIVHKLPFDTNSSSSATSRSWRRMCS